MNTRERSHIMKTYLFLIAIQNQSFQIRDNYNFTNSFQKIIQNRAIGAENLQCRKEKRKLDQESALLVKELDGLMTENNKLLLEVENMRNDSENIGAALAEAVATKSEGDRNVKE